LRVADLHAGKQHETIAPVRSLSEAPAVRDRTGLDVDIALVGSYPPPHGGQSVHVRNLLRYLRARGLGVKVLNTGSNKDVHEDGVVNIATSRSLLTKLLYGPRIKLLHVHVSSTDEFPKLVPVGLAAMLRHIPWMVTIHSGDSADRLRTAGSIRRAASRALLRGAQKIICVNSVIQTELSKLASPEAVVVVPPFSVDFSEAPLPVELEQFFSDHVPAISCVGLYEPVYGLDRAVHLMTKVREVHPRAGLLLIGDTKSADWCRALISELRLDKHVMVCGNLEHQQCLTVMSRSALFLRPTQYDGDSLSVREALALGVRVLASATDFRPDGVTLYRTHAFQDLVDKALAALESGATGTTCSINEQRNLDQVQQLYMKILG
jgi:glycosyltransferase involved in cell wall biosynthesis